MPEVIANARPNLEIDPTIVVVNLFRLHVGQLFHPVVVMSGNLVGQIGKCLPIWFLRVAGLDGQIGKCLPI